MTDPSPDLAFTLASALLGHITARLEAAGCAPGRAFVSDGVGVPADDCCSGVAWVRVAQIVATDGHGNAYREMLNAPVGPYGHSIILEAGVLRCTPVLDDQGQPPDPDEYTAAAQLISADRQALRMAVECDLPADIIAANADGQIPGAWTPLDAGGCGGGFLITEIGTSMVF